MQWTAYGAQKVQRVHDGCINDAGDTGPANKVPVKNDGQYSTTKAQNGRKVDRGGKLEVGTLDDA